MTTQSHPLRRDKVRSAVQDQRPRQPGALRTIAVGNLHPDQEVPSEAPMPLMGVSLEPGRTRLVLVAPIAKSRDRQLFATTVGHQPADSPPDGALDAWIDKVARAADRRLGAEDLVQLGIVGDGAVALQKRFSASDRLPSPIVTAEPLQAAALGEYLALSGAGAFKGDARPPRLVFVTMDGTGSAQLRGVGARGRAIEVPELDPELTRSVVRDPSENVDDLALAVVEAATQAGITGVILGGSALEPEGPIHPRIREVVEELGEGTLSVHDAQLSSLAAAVGAAHTGLALSLR